jgi:hypothetical protein
MIRKQEINFTPSEWYFSYTKHNIFHFSMLLLLIVLTDPLLGRHRLG